MENSIGHSKGQHRRWTKYQNKVRITSVGLLKGGTSHCHPSYNRPPLSLLLVGPTEAVLISSVEGGQRWTGVMHGESFDYGRFYIFKQGGPDRGGLSARIAKCSGSAEVFYSTSLTPNIP